MKMRMMFFMSLLILFVVSVTSEDTLKTYKNINEPIDSVPSFLQTRMKASPMRILDEVALDDRYERPNKKARIQDDYMGAGLSDDEKFDEFKRSIQLRGLKK